MWYGRNVILLYIYIKSNKSKIKINKIQFLDGK